MLRAEFRRRIAQFETHQLLFIDESSKDDRTFQVKKINKQSTYYLLITRHVTYCYCTPFQRHYARGLRGTRTSVKGNFTRGTRYSVLSALSVQGVVASHTIIGAFNQRLFDFAVTNFILPFIGSCARRESCSVVILDNCTIHKSNEVIQAVRRRGGIVIFLP